MELWELAVALRYFDWTYEFSDDHRVWQRAVVQKAELLRECNKSEDGRALWLFNINKRGV